MKVGFSKPMAYSKIYTQATHASLSERIGRSIGFEKRLAYGEE